MAHHIYTTQALIIEGTLTGEANKSYLLFTKELGMIRATAQGVRLLKSKLRFSLQDFTYVSVSVVRGKEIWRITSARGLAHIYDIYKDLGRKELIVMLANVCALIKRLMPQEEKHQELFEYLVEAFRYEYLPTISEDEIKSLECILVITILRELGYFGHVPMLEPYDKVTITPGILESAAHIRKRAYQEINRALHETQL